MSEASIAPIPHPVGRAFTAPHPGATATTEHIDAYLTARLTPDADISYVIDSVTVPVPGPPGPAGEDGTNWFDGFGPPIEPIPGSAPGDYYLDHDNGDVYVLSASPVKRVRALVPGG